MKILCVDWDEKTRDYVSMVLEMGMDAEMLEAGSIGEALTIIEIEEDIDFIICEVKFKNGKASELVDYIDKNQYYRPIIWLSDPKHQESLVVKETLARSEAFGFVPKPFKDDDFFPIIEKMINLSITEDMFRPSGLTLENIDEEAWEEALKEDPDADWSLMMKKKNKDDQEIEISPNKLSRASEDKKVEFDIDDWANLKIKNSITENQKIANREEAKEKLKQTIKIKIPKEEVDLTKWRRIKAKRLLSFNPVQADIYIRLKSNKYIKLIHKKDSYDHERIHNYLNKGVFFFYVPTEQYKNFLDQFSDKAFGQLEKLSGSSNTQLRSVVELACVDNIITRITEYGIDKKTVNRVDKTIQSIIKTVDKKNSLYELLQNITRGDNYISQHSLMLSYVCCEIVSGTPWGGHASIEKLSLASLLHDSAFTFDEIAIEHDKENDLSKFEDEAKGLIKDHMAIAAQYLNEGKTPYPDVDSIIFQHHERPDGAGYPRGLAGNIISPLSAVFIVAEEITKKMYKKKKDDIDFNELISLLENYYNRGNFKKPAESAVRFLKRVI